MKKVSVIITSDGNNNYLEKCINSILGQSYKNIEIVLSDKCLYKSNSDITKDKRIKVIKTKNKSNITSELIYLSKYITGDYISVINCNNYFEKDYFRLLIEVIEKNSSDVVISNIVNYNKEEKYIYGLTFNTNNNSFDGKEFYDKYFKQSGRNVRYYQLINKIIEKKIFETTINDLSVAKIKNIINIDLVLSTIILNYSKTVSFADNAICYKYNEIIKFKNYKEKVQNIEENINRINYTFKAITEFLKKEKKYIKYSKYIDIWKSYNLSIQVDNYKILKNKKENIKKIDFNYENDNKLNEFYENRKIDNSWNNYLNLKTTYTEEFHEIKELIMNEKIEVISFDMFDTLVTRPFFLPHEMFALLNKDFLELFDSIRAVDFSLIRRKSENELRDINNKRNIPEVTLDEIYDYISSTYNLEKNKLNIIKEKEIEMELKFCKRRNSGHELYSLAKYIGKKVILTSDIYLSKEIIKRILKNTGYEFDEIYLSSELLKTKSDGSMYEYIIEKEKTCNILHIGDNYETDYKRALEYNLKSCHLPKATYVMMGYTGKKVGNCGSLYKNFYQFNQDHIPYEETFGARCALGIIANYYFDNPFIPFNEESDFNGDPYFIGYYALGMQLISLCNWLIEDAKENNIDSISYMARDGHIPYIATKTYLEKTSKNNKLDLKYIYVSRKALIPLLLKDKSGISMIETYVNYNLLTPQSIINQLENVITVSNQAKKEIKNEFNFEKKFEDINEFNKCLSLIYDKCFDCKKYDNYFNICKKYFEESFTGNAATFDIGYSGKPEAIISSIINKKIRTYFIHTNNSSAFTNTRNCNSKLVTFYNYKPTITGTIRELFLSDIGPSCIGYKYENGIVKPVLKNFEKYNYYNKEMISKIQNGALNFVKDFCDYFGDYINEIDLNRYYMSIPLEYYFHYSKKIDRIPTKNLVFENNVNNYIELNDYVYDECEEYRKKYSLGVIPEKEHDSSIDYTLPNNKVKRVFYYLVHDRKKIIEKITSKLKKDI